MFFSAVVILYNPSDEVINNICSYNKAVDKLYVIDNSEDNNEFIKKKLQKLPNIKYIWLGDNKGIAYALNRALYIAINDGADFLMTMDQDTAFRGDDAYKMISYISEHHNENNIALYAANTGEYPETRNLEYVDLAITSGNVIHCETIRAIGGFDEDLFIDWVDQDLCYRLLENNHKIARLNNIRIIHHLGEEMIKKLLGYTYHYTTHNDIRYYYMVRNKFYVLNKNKIPLRKQIKFIFGVIYMVIKIILIEKNKRKKLKYVMYGYTDYLNRKMGKYRY